MKLLLLVLLCNFALSSELPDRMVSSESQGYAESFRKDVEAGRLKERTNMALDAMIRFAAFKLNRTGHKAEATKLIKEWEGQWSTYLLRCRSLGDHAPLSAWLAEKYDMLEFILGTKIMEATRLVDLKILNFGLNVVLFCVDNVDIEEFSKHFIPVSGVVVYWTTFAACMVGAGPGFIFCSPICWGAEFATKQWVAPALNAPTWRLSCKQF